MEAERNLAALREIYAGWAAGDFTASVEHFDPDVLFVMGSGFPDAGRYLGHEGVAKYTRGFLEPWTRITIEPEELIPAGDSVVAAVRQHGFGSGSGAETEFHYFQVWTFRGPKVIRFETFRERAEALGAVGLGD